ncbi:MAG: cyclase family protein [Acidimicrobiia bacterium]|nr:cyclase family protein [Acidimicrobiia bacterium]
MALPDELRELANRVSNWGRWGPDDQRGTLNLVTPEAVRRGAAAVRRGVSFSLSIPMDEDGPQIGAIPGRINPRHTMLGCNVPYTGDPSDFCASDDVVETGIQAATHWDALAHVGYDGFLYNGVPFDAVTEAGASRLGIEHFGPLVTRGLLLDLARLEGVEHLDGNRAVTGDDLDGAATAAGITVEPGDAVLVRTGQMAWLRRGDRRRYGDPSPGIGVGAIEWFHDHDVAAVATDTLVFEVWPGEDPAVLLPVHMIDLRDMGLVQGQLWYLDELAADCARDGVHEFLLAATPLPITGAVGGAVAPTATK